MFRTPYSRWLCRAVKRAYSSKPRDPAAKTKTVDARPPADTLLKNLLARIRFTGPMTVAQYMEEVLLSPRSGYYTQKDVFGSGGDFTTSPEISQMFGECLGAWVLHEWSRMGAPDKIPLQLVELGPGRGTLMDDVLRTMRKLAPERIDRTTVHLVEVSQVMRRLQEAQLCGYFGDRQMGEKLGADDLREVSSKHGPTVRWYNDLESVPQGFTFFLCHEFFDVLPIHQFVRTDDGQWREVLVDLDPNKDGQLRFVQSRERTPNAIHINPEETRDVVEVSPKAAVLMREMCRRIAERGGAALIADYGHDGTGAGDTFRAFKRHRPHHPLAEPGSADLTADVDFGYLKRHCSDHCLVYGPVEQGEFLKRLGMEVRKDVLLKNCKDEEDRSDVESAYRMLTDPDKMGSRFKFLSVFPATMKPLHEQLAPAGFQL